MNQELIRGWLTLPTGGWPPDHYTLLGLPPGEGDAALIEQRVQERMEQVRHYQLSHPELATEAMNRLAQALICLTDPGARKAYDAGLRNGARKPERELAGAARSLPTPSQAVVPTTLDLDTAKMPRLSPSNAEPPPVASAEPRRLPDASPILRSAPADPVFETARTSPAACRGLGTRRCLYQRLSLTRRLMRAWDQVGKFLTQPRRRLTRLEEENDLIRLLTAIRDLQKEFPAILGQAGQPGQHLIALARQPQLAAAFKTLNLGQRDALARDWRAGWTLLTQHRQFLREELIVHRHRTLRARIMRAVRAAINEHPFAILLCLAAVGSLVLLLFWKHWLGL